MGDKGSGAGRLATTVLLGLTVTTAAAIGLVWLYNNRRRQRSPSNSSREVYAQYASEIVQSLENQSSAPIPIKYNNSQNNSTHSHARISDPSDGANIKTELSEPSDTNNIGGNIIVAASAKSAAPVLEAAQKLKEEQEEDLVDGEEDERGVDHRNIRNMGEREEDKHVNVECIIPKDSVAGVIGRKGIQIKLIQKDSNTRIHFNNETLENGDRVCVIRGRADDVAIAGDMIRKFVASQPVTLTKEILVPQQSVGRIIGRQGENIRGIQDLSKAKINIDSGRFESREGDDTVYNVVVLKGNSEQIEAAEALILETVEEERNFRNNIRGQAASRTMRRANPPPTLSPPPPPRISPTSPHPPLKQSHNLIPNFNGITQVYVSCVYHPNMFWIQQVGPDSIELDKLGEAMTEYYHKDDPSQGDYNEEFSVGDIVAAPFPLDHKMYRGKVIAKVAAETVEVEYVDYGDRRHVDIKELRTLSPHFLSLKFQAIQASLDLTCPGVKWSDEVITRFCDLSYCAQWKCITGKAKGFSSHPTDNSKQTTLLLELMDEDVNIGEKLIQEGLARHKDDYSLPQPHAQPPSVPMSGSGNESSIESNGVDQ